MNEDSEDDDDEEEEENDDEEEEVEDDDEDEEVNEEDEEDTESDRDAHCVGYCLSSAKGSCIPQACERSCELDDEDYEDLELYLAKRSKRKACLNDSSDFSDYEVEDLITQELRNMVADLSSDSSSELYSDSEEVDSNSDLDSDSVWDSISEDSNPDTAFDAAVDEAQCCGYSIQPNPRKRSLWEIEDNEVDSVDEPAKKKEKKETSYVKAFAREAGKGLLYVLATVVALGVYGGTISSQK
ncbi:hypothetical protein DFJ63DRAFT_318462 [Scheffersomyces coipomensis]|uniref:uncharacterized protein n=1 Tax=Scheffersomyces coipomensis TaxID=1788519 RepID=UPI00315E0175